MSLRILTTVYNAAPYLRRCIDSIKCQNLLDWRCYLLDDLSTDDSSQVIQTSIDSRFEHIVNRAKLWQLGNYQAIIRQFEDEDICIEVDGDDWLPDAGVFKRITSIYENRSAWVTWGNCIQFGKDFTELGWYNSDRGLANIRNYTWTPFHLRTWKVGLWRRIPEVDLRDDNGQFFQVAGDLAFMYPMIEMAGKHAIFCPEINYCYNAANPLCNIFCRPDLQKLNDQKIRAKKSYIPRLML